MLNLNALPVRHRWAFPGASLDFDSANNRLHGPSFSVWPISAGPWFDHAQGTLFTRTVVSAETLPDFSAVIGFDWEDGSVFGAVGGVRLHLLSSADGQEHKMALAWAKNDVAAVADGGVVLKHNSAVIPEVDALYADGVLRVAYFPVRLPDAELKALTT